LRNATLATAGPNRYTESGAPPIHSTGAKEPAMRKATRRAAVVASVVWSLAGLALPVASAEAQPMSRTELRAKQENVSKMLRQVSISFDNQRREDVMAFIQQLTGADLDIMWVDDRYPDGLDKESPITLQVKNVTAMVLLEKVLAKA